MAGNVYEWVADWYSSTYYTLQLVDNPTGPESGSNRVVRGGSFYSLDVNLRVSFRYYYNPSGYYDDLGFRCARSE